MGEAVKYSTWNNWGLNKGFFQGTLLFNKHRDAEEHSNNISPHKSLTKSRIYEILVPPIDLKILLADQYIEMNWKEHIKGEVKQEKLVIGVCKQDVPMMVWSFNQEFSTPSTKNVGQTISKIY